MRFKELFNLTGIPIFIASLCCITPIAIVLFGLGTISFAASLNNLLEGRFQWTFILSGIISLAVSLVIYFRKRGICTLDQAKKRRNEIINKAIMILAVATIGYIIFFYGIVGYIGRLLKIWS